MIHQLDFNGIDKVEKAIQRLQLYEPPEGFYLCFSGGKDSVVIKALADMAGVKYDAHYNVTSVDPPELVRFIKDTYPDVIFEHQRDKNGNIITMWNLIPKKSMPPTRLVRYCCASLKETGGKGRLKVTGVRWDESSRRKKGHGEVTIMSKKAKEIALEEYDDIAYKLTPQGGIALPLDNRENAKMVEQCYRTRSTTVNPIIDWTDSEVWEFIREYNVPYCCLYDEGHTRLGCIGCPMANKKIGNSTLRGGRNISVYILRLLRKCLSTEDIVKACRIHQRKCSTLGYRIHGKHYRKPMKHLISDTREKKNQHVLDYFEAVGIKYEIAKLDFGDYMDAYRPGLVIDRKQNIAELAKNVVGKDRDRFVRELERAQAAGSKMVILVEQNRYKDRERWISVKEPADLMLWSSPHTKIRGERVFRSVNGLIAQYGISVQFCDKRTTGRNILRIIYGDSYE